MPISQSVSRWARRRRQNCRPQTEGAAAEGQETCMAVRARKKRRHADTSLAWCAHTGWDAPCGPGRLGPHSPNVRSLSLCVCVRALCVPPRVWPGLKAQPSIEGATHVKKHRPGHSQSAAWPRAPPIRRIGDKAQPPPQTGCMLNAWDPKQPPHVVNCGAVWCGAVLLTLSDTLTPSGGRQAGRQGYTNAIYTHNIVLLLT